MLLGDSLYFLQMQEILWEYYWRRRKKGYLLHHVCNSHLAVEDQILMIPFKDTNMIFYDMSEVQYSSRKIAAITPQYYKQNFCKTNVALSLYFRQLQLSEVVSEVLRYCGYLNKHHFTHT